MINVPGTAVELHPADLPMTWAARLHELRRLSKIVHVPVNEMLRGIKARGNDPVTPVVVREDVKRTAPINYLYEHADEFPGVSVTNTYLRYYPHGDLAAHVLGYVNEISAAQLKPLQRKGYAAGDKIGEAGVEGSYDSYLRGPRGPRAAARRLARPAAQPARDEAPAGQGESIKLTIDSKLQRAAEQAILYGIDQAYAEQALAGRRRRDRRARPARRLDPRDGLVPDLQPEHLHRPRDDEAAGGGRPDALDRRAATNYPSLDRASNGVYPAGSTFKPVTALAAMETGKLLALDAARSARASTRSTASSTGASPRPSTTSTRTSTSR